MTASDESALGEAATSAEGDQNPIPSGGSSMPTISPDHDKALTPKPTIALLDARSSAEILPTLAVDEGVTSTLATIACGRYTGQIVRWDANDAGDLYSSGPSLQVRCANKGGAECFSCDLLVELDDADSFVAFATAAIATMHGFTEGAA